MERRLSLWLVVVEISFLSSLEDIGLTGQIHSIVLENLAYGFVKPNILDIKLGRELYDEEASAEKVERMKKAARETTSWETGVRLTGFQVRAGFEILKDVNLLLGARQHDGGSGDDAQVVRKVAVGI